MNVNKLVAHMKYLISPMCAQLATIAEIGIHILACTLQKEMITLRSLHFDL